MYFISRQIILLWMVTCVIGLWTVVESSDSPVVSLSLGDLRGRVSRTLTSDTPVYIFAGVPYAEPPVGDLQFSVPRLWETPWEGERDATKYGAVCAQGMAVIQYGYGPSVTPTNTSSEDCLFLDVYTPNLSPHTPLPVLVFIDGGGYIYGTGSMYDGTALAALQNLVVVTMNYRLGAFGYFHQPTDGGESFTGHLGHLDQLVALQWIQTHIERFGGDPNRVTLSGESAGARSVSHHILSPLSSGLFHSAIIHSGYYLTNTAPRKEHDLLSEFTTALGCSEGSVEELMLCLSASSTEDIVVVTEELHVTHRNLGLWTPPLDTPHAVKEINAGHFNQVPVMIGVTANEGYDLAQFIFPEILEEQTKPMSYKTDVVPPVRTYLSHLYDPHLPSFDQIVSEVLDFYFGDAPLPLGDEIYLRRRITEVLGDSYLMAPTVLLAGILAAASPHDVYFYEFAHRAWYETRPSWHRGCDHAHEMQFLWGTPFMNSHTTSNATYTKQEELFSTTVMTYLGNFVKYGDPNPPDTSPSWPPYTTSSQDYLILQPDQMSAARYKRNRAAFWNTKLHHLKHSKPRHEPHEEL